MCCFSGDKLIGGSQAGIIVGKKPLVDRIRKHPLTRMLRVGKLTDMALEHTLRLFLEPEKLLERHPRCGCSPSRWKASARVPRRWARRWPAFPLDVAIVAMASATGGGSLPAVDIPSWGLRVARPGWSADALAQALRYNEPPIIARVQEDAVWLDARTLLEGEENDVTDALRRIGLYES